MKIKNKCIKNIVFILIFSALNIIFSNSVLANADHLRIITYNIQGLPKPIMLSHKKIKQIPAEIKQFNADVITFQETFTKDAALLSQMPEFPYHAYGTLQGHGKFSSGLLIVSKFPISNKRIFKYSKCTGTDCFAQKGLLGVTINLPGNKEINVITTHFNAGSNSKIKWDQIRELKVFISKFYRNKTFILTGDFNLPSKGIYYDELASFASLEDSHKIYTGDHPNLSDYDRNSYTFSKKGPFGYIIEPKKIDFIWFNNEGQVFLETEKSKMIMDKITGKKLSDHFSLMVDFELE